MLHFSNMNAALQKLVELLLKAALSLYASHHIHIHQHVHQYWQATFHQCKV